MPSRNKYIRVKCPYCNKEYDVRVSCFIYENNNCSYCCNCYENSFAYYIEVELREPIEKYWDYDKNTVDPWSIAPKSNKKVWIKCQEVDYHGSYEIACGHFTNGKRCPYCCNFHGKVHPLDSFGYHNFDKACMNWSNKNTISPFKVSPCSSKLIWFICDNCGIEFEKKLSYITLNNAWCPYCSMSKGEKMISKWLRENNIDHTYEMTYKDLVGLGGGLLSYDFYLPKYNILIEYQGEFHDGNLKDKNYQTQEQFEYQQEHDMRKYNYANRHNIELLEIWYWDFDNIENILEKTLKL